MLDTGVYDEVISVTDEDAFATGRELGRTEGLLAGISSGAACGLPSSWRNGRRTRANGSLSCCRTRATAICPPPLFGG